MKMEELLSKLNKESKQNEFLEEDNSIWNILDLVEAKEVETGLDVDKHRWYERTTTVFEVKCDDNKKLLGINSVTDLSNENSTIDDLFCEYDFFEMEAINIISYKRKKI